MKIEKIIYEKDHEKNLFTTCTVCYEDGTREKKDDVVDVIMEFMDQEGLTFANVMKDKRIIENKSVIKSDETHDKVVSDSSSTSSSKGKETTSDERIIVRRSGDTTVSDSTPKNKKRTGIRILSIASALVLGSIGLQYFINKTKSKEFEPLINKV